MYGSSSDARQAIPNPAGVSSFGSAIIRVPPDLALLRLGVRSLKDKPEDAFADARKKNDAVRAFLRSVGASEVASSRITLRQETRYAE